MVDKNIAKILIEQRSPDHFLNDDLYLKVMKDLIIKYKLYLSADSRLTSCLMKVPSTTLDMYII